MPFNAANSLTLLRIVMIPVLVGVFYLDVSWRPWLTAGLFAAAAITDWLDGYVARRFDQTSRFGAFLDPVADKLMVGVVLVLLTQRHPTAALAVPAAIIIGREITISALREWMAELGQRSAVDVRWIGKVKTTFQMAAIVLLLLERPVLGVPVVLVGHVALWLAAGLTLWSMVQYLRAAWPLIVAPAPKPED